MASTPVQFVPGAGTGFLASETLGGRRVCRDTNGTTWFFVNEIEGGTSHYLVAYAVGVDGLVAQRELVAGPVSPGYVGVACCIDGSDRPIVVATRLGTSDLLVYRRESSVWTLKATLSPFADALRSFQVLADQAGGFHLVYADYRASLTLQQFQHRTSSDLVTWAAATTVEDLGNGIDENTLERRAAAALDHQGAIVFCWVLVEAARWRIRYAKYSGGSWGSVETVVDPPGNMVSQKPKHLSIAADGAGVPFIAWASQTRDTFPGSIGVWYSHRTGGTWSTAHQLHSSVVQSQRLPAIAVNSTGVVSVVWAGDGVLATVGHDRLMRSAGSGVSFAVDEIANPGTAVSGPDQPFAWEPFGHGLVEVGYFALGIAGGAGFFAASSPIEWNLEPRPATALGFAGAGTKGGSVQGFATSLVLAGLVKITREKHVAATTTLAFATKFALPFGGSQLVFGQAVSLAGSVWNRAASSVVDFAGAALRELPALCETVYQPNPAIPATDSSFAAVFFLGPYPAPTLQIKLPLPLYGDEREVDLRTIVLRTRHGEVHLGVRPISSKDPTHSFRLSWSQLSRKKVLEVDSFLKQMTGELVIYRDGNGHRWACHVETPALDSRRSSKDFAGSLDLKVTGVLIP